MQTSTSFSEYRREVNTLTWVVFAGAMIALTVLFVYVLNRQQIQKLMSKASNFSTQQP